MSKRNDNRGGLSLQTLVIASLSSLAAALVVHKVWQGGAFVGAAITPVVVALVSEALRKPAEVLSTRTTRNPPPVVVEERPDDRFGIWEAQKPPRRRLHVGLALATGLVAFAIAAFFLTGAELVLGGASDSDRFRVLPGKQERSSDRDRDREPREQEPDAPAPAPDEREEPPEDEPPATEPPAETVPPTQTAPPQTTPAPGATTPAEP